MRWTGPTSCGSSWNFPMPPAGCSPRARCSRRCPPERRPRTKETAMSTMHSLLAATILAMAGCNSVASGNNDAPGTGRAASGGTVADGSTFDMRPGQSVTLADGSALRYERLVNESRCMPDVQCVWAGDAEVAFTWKPVDGPAEAFSLHTGKEPRRHAV